MCAYINRTSKIWPATPRESTVAIQLVRQLSWSWLEFSEVSTTKVLQYNNYRWKNGSTRMDYVYESKTALSLAHVLYYHNNYPLGIREKHMNWTYSKTASDESLEHFHWLSAIQAVLIPHDWPLNTDKTSFWVSLNFSIVFISIQTLQKSSRRISKLNCMGLYSPICCGSLLNLEAQ